MNDQEVRTTPAPPRPLAWATVGAPSSEVVPLAPSTTELMRAYLLANGSTHPVREATLIAVLGYAGLRPSEALGVRWAMCGTRTLLVQRAVSYGTEQATKTGANRTVRLLDPLRRDLAEWQLVSGRRGHDTLVFPANNGELWSKSAYQSWRRRAFARSLRAAGVAHARPDDLRHPYASLLLHEGRSVIYVARQLEHDARLTLSRYGHLIDGLDGTPHMDAETAIRAAREPHVPPSFLLTAGT